MEIKEIEKYTKVVIPNIEKQLSMSGKSDQERYDLYNLYLEVLRMVAPFDFISFNKYLEIDENHNDPNRAFYHHRRHHLSEIFNAMNDIEIYNKYDMLLISMPPRVGKSQTNIRFEAWIAGRHPLETQLGTSYSDSITNSFYNGVMEIVTSQRFREVFPDALLTNQNAKRQEIWLKETRRYPSLVFVSIDGSMTGRAEASRYLFCDDLVSGIEMAMSLPRLEKLWQTYTVNAKQRKKDGAREIHLATKWSVHDPITRLARENADNPRCKIINVPCYNELGESNFNFFGGFSTEYYKELERSMDSFSFGALYKGEPIEREGLLYKEEDLNYYFELPEGLPDTTIAVCDSKNMGKDYVCSLVGKIYNNTLYLDDVVYNNGLPEITIPLVAKLWYENKVVYGQIEANNGGGYYAQLVDEELKKYGGKTSIKTFFSTNNKTVRIITYSDFVIKNIVFKHKSTYSQNSEYGEFIRSILSWTQSGKNKHDDSVDALSMLAQMFQELEGNKVGILNRRVLGI